MTPIQRGAISGFFGELCHDPRGCCAGWLQFQRAACSQACRPIVCSFDRKSGALNQPPLLPARIETVTTPEDGNDHKESQECAKRKLQVEAFGAFVRKFDLR